MDSVKSETKLSLASDSWVRIVTETPRYAEGAGWRYLEPFPPRYYHDAAEITVQVAADLLADAEYPVRCDNGSLVFIDAD